MPFDIKIYMEKIQLGLKENWKQFTLLVIINAFVGGMIGLERSILPQIAEVEFHIEAKTAILSFIVVFGIVKAITNYFTGALANKIGRKNLLTIGWLVGIPVPFVLMFADSWNWIVAANILLGINQGLTWSSTVVMKIDLVGEKQRGFAMGLNEFAGYLAVAVVAFLTGWIASEYGLRPYPFYIGIALSLMGFFASWLLVKDTKHHIAVETTTSFLNSKIFSGKQPGKIKILDQLHRPAWSTISMTAWPGGCSPFCWHQKDLLLDKSE